MTEKTLKALKVLYSREEGMTANLFAYELWGDDPEKEDLFLAMSNQGNGACAGKKAWLCAGSYLAKLCKAGYVTKTRDFKFRLTTKGKEICEKSNSKARVR